MCVCVFLFQSAGYIDLTRLVSVSEAKADTAKFNILIRSDDGEERVYPLAADNAEDRNAWTKILHEQQQARLGGGFVKVGNGAKVIATSSTWLQQ